MAIPLKYSWRSLWERRTTTFAAALGIALVVFVLASSLMLAQGLRETLARAGRVDHVLVTQQDAYSEGNSRLRQSLAGLVAAAPGVAPSGNGVLVTAETVVHVYLQQVANAERQASVQVRGVSANVFAMRPDARIIAGRAAKSGTNEAVVGAAIAGQYVGLALNERLTLQKNREVTIVGIFAAAGSAYESEVWADLDVVRGAFGFEGYLSSVTARLTSPAAFDAFAAALKLQMPEGLNVEREQNYYARVSNNLSTVIAGLGGVVTFIFCFGAMLGAAITMFGAVNLRVREIGVLRALGFGSSQVLVAVLAEALALALLGGGVGLVLALLTPLLRFSAVNWVTGQELVFGFQVSPGIALGALLCGAGVGLLGGIFPALRAARINPLQAIRAP
jgi:putative ABC transport system permease protein